MSDKQIVPYHKPLTRFVSSKADVIVSVFFPLDQFRQKVVFCFGVDFHQISSRFAAASSLRIIPVAARRIKVVATSVETILGVENQIIS